MPLSTLTTKVASIMNIDEAQVVPMESMRKPVNSSMNEPLENICPLLLSRLASVVRCLVGSGTRQSASAMSVGRRIRAMKPTMVNPSLGSEP